MREKIKLESSAGTGHFYTTTKNKRTTPDKLEIKVLDHFIVAGSQTLSFAERGLL